MLTVPDYAIDAFVDAVAKTLVLGAGSRISAETLAQIRKDAVAGLPALFAAMIEKEDAVQTEAMEHGGHDVGRCHRRSAAMQVPRPQCDETGGAPAAWDAA